MTYEKTIVIDSVPDGDGVEWSLKPRIIHAGPSVIVVGPDGVGKTTIVRHLSERTGIPSFKCPSEKEIFCTNGIDSLTFDLSLTHFLAQTGHRFISDRGYPCEWVYSQVFWRATDILKLRAIDDRHAKLGTVILYLYSSVQPLQEDDIVPSEKYWPVKRGYDEFMTWTGCRVLSLDTAEMLQVYQEGGDVSSDYCDRAMALIRGIGVKL